MYCIVSGGIVVSMVVFVCWRVFIYLFIFDRRSTKPMPNTLRTKKKTRHNRRKVRPPHLL